MKTTTTLYLDEDIIRKAKQQLSSISDTVNRFLRILVENPNISEEEALLLQLSIHRNSLVSKIESLEAELIYTRKELKSYEEQILDQRRIVEETKRQERIALLFRQLNAVIEQNLFDPDDAWDETEDIREQLIELDHEFTREGFEVHCKRLSQLHLGAVM